MSDANEALKQIEQLKTESEYEVDDLPVLTESEQAPDVKMSPAEAYSILEEYNIDSEEMTKREVIEAAERIKRKAAKFVQVLSRGQTNDMIRRVLEKVPDHLHAELVMASDLIIPRYEAMGFEVWSDPEASKAGSHKDGDTTVRVGDCILMVMPKEDYAILDKIRRDRRTRKRLAAERAKVKTQMASIGVETI